MGSISLKNIKILLFQIFGKSQNKVVVAEETGCGNDIVFSKIGWENDLRQKKLNICDGNLVKMKC